MNEQGHIPIIDFRQAGYVREYIPSWKTLEVKLTEVFSVNADRLALAKIIGMHGPSKNSILKLTINSQMC